MDGVGLVVPVMKNFKGFTELIRSVDESVHPFIMSNWIHNAGVSAGWNWGIKMSVTAHLDYALVCNDDVQLNPYCIQRLREALHDRIFVSGTQGIFANGLVGFGNTPDFACFMVRPQDFIDKYGLFDENFSPAYFEDNDMAYRIKLAGDTYPNRLDATFYHAGSVTQNMDGPVVTSPMFERNRSYYVSKWGGVPLAETLTHPFNDESLHPNDWVTHE